MSIFITVLIVIVAFVLIPLGTGYLIAKGQP